MYIILCYIYIVCYIYILYHRGEFPVSLFIASRYLVQPKKKLFNGRRERAFVECWLEHVLNKIVSTTDDVIRAMDNQIMDLMKARCGVKISREAYYTLKDKFITRPGKPARKCELLKETYKGSRFDGQVVGRPSEYELSALSWLLEQELGGEGPAQVLEDT